MSPVSSLYDEIENSDGDLQKRFEVQPMTRKQTPYGDLLQIAVPNSSSVDQFLILIQAFMRASRLPFPPKDSYWASNVVLGVGMGT